MPNWSKLPDQAKEANEYLLLSYKEKRPLNETLVNKIQGLLTQKTYDTKLWQLGERPGEYKHHDYVSGKNEIGASAHEVAE